MPMSIQRLTEEKIGAYEARRCFGEILQKVASTGDKILVERYGEPIAAVVPIEVYQQWKLSRQDFFDKIRAAAEKSNLSSKKAEALADQAVAFVRKRNR